MIFFILQYICWQNSNKTRCFRRPVLWHGLLLADTLSVALSVKCPFMKDDWKSLFFRSVHPSLVQYIVAWLSDKNRYSICNGPFLFMQNTFHPTGWEKSRIFYDLIHFWDMLCQTSKTVDNVRNICFSNLYCTIWQKLTFIPSAYMDW